MPARVARVDAGGCTRSARRRRERRPRSVRRHERMSVAMAGRSGCTSTALAWCYMSRLAQWWQRVLFPHVRDGPLAGGAPLLHDAFWDSALAPHSLDNFGGVTSQSASSVASLLLVPQDREDLVKAAKTCHCVRLRSSCSCVCVDRGGATHRIFLRISCRGEETCQIVVSLSWQFSGSQCGADSPL